MTNFFKDLKLVGKATETIEGLNQRCTELQTLLENSQSLVDQANQAKDQTESRLNESNNLLQNTQSELGELRSILSVLQIQQSETAEENELLLLQLHQVQEELEHYFLQYQDIKQQAETTQQQLDRVLADNPNYFSYDEIHCEPVNGQAESLHWIVSGLFGAGRHWEICQFDTIIEKGIAGFVFKKGADSSSPLAFWPNSHTGQTELTCIPTGTTENAIERAELLKTLSTSDWQLLKLLPEVLKSALNKDPSLAPTIQNQVLHALHKTHDLLLKHLPTVLRFDNVELTKALVHPGYEHLAIRVHNLKFGKQIYPTFDFRLGCANVTEHQFGTDPKLEFPLVNNKSQIESWYAESEDEFGKKLEIRFAKPCEMDINVWMKLKHSDQKLISEIVSRLPNWIAELPQNYQKIGRPVQEWVSLAEDLRWVFKQHATN